MKFKQFATVLRVCALAALFVVGTSAAAFALPLVNFSTTGDFAGAPTTSVTILGALPGNSATFTFGGVNTSLDAPSNTSFGTITTTITGLGVLAPGFTTGFTMTVHQTAPSVGQADFVGNLAGNFTSNAQGDFFLNFTTPFITIGSVTYTLQQPPGGYAIVPPNVNGGVTSIQGAFSAPSTVPEPASMLLLGTGLLAAFRARRKVGIQ